MSFASGALLLLLEIVLVLLAPLDLQILQNACRCPQQEAMAPFPPTATCVLPMNAKQYYAIQDTPGFRSLLAQVGVL